MDDDKLKEIFEKYDPVLESEDRFMATLEHRLDAVEMIRQQVEATCHNSKLALILAGIVGFITGIICTYLMPYMYALVQNCSEMVSSFSWAEEMMSHYMLISWSLAAIICVVVAVNVYDVTLCLASRRHAPDLKI